MKDWIEKHGPYTAALLLSGLYILFFRDLKIPVSVKSLYSSAVSIGAVSIGFLATTKSILFSIHDREIIKWIKGAGLYKTLIDYIMSAIHFCFFMAICSAFILILNPASIENYAWIFGAWLFFSIAAGLSCYRVIHLLSTILLRQ